MLEKIKRYQEVQGITHDTVKEMLGYAPITANISLDGLVNTLITMPECLDEFYAFTSDDLPDKSSTVYRMLEHMVIDSMDIDDDAHVLQVHNLYNYQAKWKDDTKLKKFREHTNLFDFIKHTKGKTIMSLDDHRNALGIVDMLLEYIPDTSIFNTDAYRKMYGVDCKGLIGIITPDTQGDIITKVHISSAPLSDFKRVFKKYRFDLELSFYASLRGQEKARVLFYSIPDNAVLEYNLTALDLEIGMFGFKKKEAIIVNGVKYKYTVDTLGWVNVLFTPNEDDKESPKQSVWMS